MPTMSEADSDSGSEDELFKPRTKTKEEKFKEEQEYQEFAKDRLAEKNPTQTLATLLKVCAVLLCSPIHGLIELCIYIKCIHARKYTHTIMHTRVLSYVYILPTCIDGPEISQV